MAFKFENLIVWQKAMDLNDLVFQISKGFPPEEKFNLTSQIRRAIDSVSLNIAEGSTSQSNPEFSRFLGYSNSIFCGSCMRIVYCKKEELYY